VKPTVNSQNSCANPRTMARREDPVSTPWSPSVDPSKSTLEIPVRDILSELSYPSRGRRCPGQPRVPIPLVKANPAPEVLARLLASNGASLLSTSPSVGAEIPDGAFCRGSAPPGIAIFPMAHIQEGA